MLFELNARKQTEQQDLQKAFCFSDQLEQVSSLRTNIFPFYQILTHYWLHSNVADIAKRVEAVSLVIRADEICVYFN